MPKEEKKLTLEERIKKKYGDGILVSGDDILDREQQVIPISPALNIALSGGVPEGTWMNLSSKPKVGKTTSALQFAANCQREEYGGRKVYYLDIEGRLKKLNLAGIPDFRTDPKYFHAIQSTEDKILSAQDYLSIAEDILKNEKRCVMIIDSYSALCHEKELTEGIGTSTRGAGAYSLLSGFCRQMSNVIPVMKSNIVGIVQLMANVSGYGSALIEKGGMGIAYQCDIWLRAKSMEPWKDGTKQIGQIVTWTCLASALGPPGIEVNSYIRYGKGIDALQEICQYAEDINLIERHGAWYYCLFMKNHPELLNGVTADECKGQGEHGLHKLLSENPEWIAALQSDIIKIVSGNTNES
jgi:recombination protein RecA